MTQDKGKGLFSQAGGWLGIVLAEAVVFTTYEKYGFVHSHLSLSQSVPAPGTFNPPCAHVPCHGSKSFMFTSSVPSLRPHPTQFLSFW